MFVKIWFKGEKEHLLYVCVFVFLFMAESQKGTREVTKTTQFIGRCNPKSRDIGYWILHPGNRDIGCHKVRQDIEI